MKSNQHAIGKLNVEGILQAYDAVAFNGTLPKGNTRMKLLRQNTSPGTPKSVDIRYTYSKFCPRVVADDKILLAAYGSRVIVFGL